MTNTNTKKNPTGQNTESSGQSGGAKNLQGGQGKEFQSGQAGYPEGKPNVGANVGKAGSNIEGQGRGNIAGQAQTGQQYEMGGSRGDTGRGGQRTGQGDRPKTGMGEEE